VNKGRKRAEASGPWPLRLFASLLAACVHLTYHSVSAGQVAKPLSGSVMRSQCSTAAVPTGGNGGSKTGLCSPTAGATPPALGLSPQAAAGMNTLWNANAGAAIMTSISADTNDAARIP
jgi:hypothetical protein